MSALIRVDDVRLCFCRLREVKWKYSLFGSVGVLFSICQLVNSKNNSGRRNQMRSVSVFIGAASVNGSLMGQNRSCSLPISEADVSYCWTRIMAITASGQRLLECMCGSELTPL